MPACVIEDIQPALEKLLRELELKAATEKAITCSDVVKLRIQLEACFGNVKVDG